jgi:hypothetical protein
MMPIRAEALLRPSILPVKCLIVGAKQTKSERRSNDAIDPKQKLIGFTFAVSRERLHIKVWLHRVHRRHVDGTRQRPLGLFAAPTLQIR